ncbi:hypothetical protein K4F52_010033 [Lecanicillium sp. MT-2017a]|nr:hypothetical protein K4F52_010033 [Lecanicillium sp. MT-2017a]
MAGREEQVTPATPMPTGYKFLKKGNPYLTSLCRRMTLAEGKRLFVVIEKSKALGLRAPKWIINHAYNEERGTRTKRQEAVATRDSAIERAFADAAREQFPDMPAKDADAVIARAVKKRSGRVGRTGTLSIESKVRLAVGAHIRHTHTDYDKLIRQKGGGREAARKEVQGDVKELLNKWQGNRRRERPMTDRQRAKQKQTKKTQPKAKDSKQGRRAPKRAEQTHAKGRQSTEESEQTTETISSRLRSAKTSTADDPILISSGSDGEVEGLDASDVSSTEDWIEDDEEEGDDDDFDTDSVIVLD